MKQRLPLMISVIGLVLYGGTAVASASTVGQGSTPHDRYCVAKAVPVGSSRIATATCYQTFAESVRVATGGRVNLSATARPGSVTPDMLNAGQASPSTIYVLSIDYVDANFSGASLIWTQSSKCGNYKDAGMPSGWNDVISSVSTGSTCANTLYQNASYGGTSYKVGKNSAVSYVGSFNDEASSEKWCPSYPCT